MTYLVTARKWRPMVFEDIVGQSHITTTLKNAISTHRLSHAYVFSGPRGVGKTTTARILAKAINCLHPVDADPDNTCELCREITEGRSVNVFEIDGASNRGVDEIRNLREAVRYGPARGTYKVYIIDEVHMLTKEAFNALLKTLEEPPSYVIFVFATTEIQKVPLTILSRCQRFDFRRIPIAEITARLAFIAKEEKVTIDSDALFLLAKRGDGSMRDAQSLFDQVVSFTGETVRAEDVRSMLNIVDDELYFRATEIIRAGDVKGGLLLLDGVVNAGFDLREFLNGLTEHLRNLLVAKSTQSADLIEISDEHRKRYIEASAQFQENDLLRLIAIACNTDAALRWSHQPRIRLELGLVQMIKLDRSIEISSLLAQIDELKKNPADRRGLADEPARPRSEREAAVVGSVKASPPTLRSDQIVEHPNASTESSGKLALSNDPPPSSPSAWPSITTDALPERPAGMGKLSDTDAHAKWPGLVEEACRQRIAVGTVLGEATLVGVTGDRLRISCPDDFHLDALRRNRQFLADLAHKVYGVRIQVETALPNQGSPSSASEPAPAPAANGLASHPMVQALMHEFGAREVE